MTRLMEATVRPVARRCTPPLVTAAGRLARRDGVIVGLRGSDGTFGVGEATPLPSFGTGSLAACRAGLERALRARRGAELPGPCDEEAWLDEAGLAPVARYGLETALLDRRARAEGRPLAALLGGGRAPADPVRVAALVGDADPAAVAAAVGRARDRGFGTVKLKVGAGALARDLERLRAARAAAGTDLALRLDANGAFDPDAARRFLDAVAPFHVEFVEEPLADRDPEALAALRAATSVALAADESAGDPASARAVLDAGAIDVLVLKPAVLGGLRRARALARAAGAAGCAGVLSSALDGAVSVTACLHLAAVLDPAGPAHGLGTADHLRGDVAPAPILFRGRWRCTDAPGHGVRPAA